MARLKFENTKSMKGHGMFKGGSAGLFHDYMSPINTLKTDGARAPGVVWQAVLLRLRRPSVSQNQWRQRLTRGVLGLCPFQQRSQTGKALGLVGVRIMFNTFPRTGKNQNSDARRGPILSPCTPWGPMRGGQGCNGDFGPARF